MQRLILKNNLGFTLLEILLTIAIMSLVAAFSYAGFSQFNRTQQLASAYNDLKNAFHEAKGNALSQIVTCATEQNLIGYQITFPNESTYQLEEVCQDETIVVKTTTLPSSVTVTANPATFLFLVLTGEFSNAGNLGSVEISNGGTPRVITVYPIGRIE